MTLVFCTLFFSKSRVPDFQKAGCPIFKNSGCRLTGRLGILGNLYFIAFIAVQIILESVRHSSLQFIGKPNVRKQAILNLRRLNKMLGSRCIFPIRRHILCTEKVALISNRYTFYSFITLNTYSPKHYLPYKHTT